MMSICFAFKKYFSINKQDKNKEKNSNSSIEDSILSLLGS